MFSKSLEIESNYVVTYLTLAMTVENILNCDELPSSDTFAFNDIVVLQQNKQVQNPDWSEFNSPPICHENTQVLNTTVQFNWKSHHKF